MIEYRTVLAVTDFSPASSNAAWRAGMVASSRKARLDLLHVVPRHAPIPRSDGPYRRPRVRKVRVKERYGSRLKGRDDSRRPE